MKKLIIVLALFGLTIGAKAQQMAPESKPDMELTKKEAELRIADWDSRIKSLEDKLSKLKGDEENIRKQLNDAIASLKDCRDAYAKLLGASDADIEAFKQKLGILEGKVREYQKLANDDLADKRAEIEALQNEYFNFRNNKIAVLPEFFDRLITLGTNIKGLFREKSIKTYTVGTWAENKDCLWNIAGKTEIFADPFLWPKIWQQNKDIIRNPDVIYPGQVLTLPKKADKTSDETKAERKYWRNKKAAIEKKVGQENIGKTGK